jgi:hypothetical protein
VQWKPDNREWNRDQHETYSVELQRGLTRLAQEQTEPIKSWVSLFGIMDAAQWVLDYKIAPWSEKLFMQGFGLAVFAEAEPQGETKPVPYGCRRTAGNIGIAVFPHESAPDCSYDHNYVDKPSTSVQSGYNYPVTLPVTAYLGPSNAIRQLEHRGNAPTEAISSLGTLVLTSV